MIAIGSDHGGYKLKEEIKKYLEEKEIEYTDCGTFDEESVDYPEIAQAVSTEVQDRHAEKGIIICRSGIGMSIVANKFKGIRCAKCNDEEEAKFSRMHNDSNVLALGAGLEDSNTGSYWDYESKSWKWIYEKEEEESAPVEYRVPTTSELEDIVKSRFTYRLYLGDRYISTADAYVYDNTGYFKCNYDTKGSSREVIG